MYAKSQAWLKSSTPAHDQTVHPTYSLLNGGEKRHFSMTKSFNWLELYDNWKDQIWFGTCILKWEENLLFAKRPSPKIGGVCLGNAECVSMKLSTWKDGFDLGQHVTEDQRELGEVPSTREQDEQRQKHRVSTLNRQEISSQCKCTHIERKVNS